MCVWVRFSYSIFMDVVDIAPSNACNRSFWCGIYRGDSVSWESEHTFASFACATGLLVVSTILRCYGVRFYDSVWYWYAWCGHFSLRTEFSAALVHQALFEDVQKRVWLTIWLSAVVSRRYSPSLNSSCIQCVDCVHHFDFGVIANTGFLLIIMTAYLLGDLGYLC